MIKKKLNQFLLVRVYKKRFTAKYSAYAMKLKVHLSRTLASELN